MPPRPGVDASQFASASIQACLPPPDVPTGTPGRATFGFKLTQVNFKVNGVFTSAGTGEPRWRVLATPYTPNTGRSNPAGSVEAQSVIAFPRSVVLSRPTVRTNRGFATLAIRGNVLAPAGAPVTLRLYRGTRPPRRCARSRCARSATATRGTLRIRQTARRQVVFLRTRGDDPGRHRAVHGDLRRRRASRRTVRRWPLTSNSVRVVIPARQR